MKQNTENKKTVTTPEITHTHTHTHTHTRTLVIKTLSLIMKKQISETVVSEAHLCTLCPEDLALKIIHWNVILKI